MAQHLRQLLGSFDLQVPVLCRREDCAVADVKLFTRFPEDCGRTITSDLEIQISPDHSFPLMESGAFVQCWLFFGLAFVVVKTDRPLLSFNDLVDSSCDFIDTSKLRDAVEKWQRWEEENAKSSKVRLANATFALNYARKIVRSNFAVSGIQSNMQASNPDYVPSEVALSIMLLGEYLSTIVAQMKDKLNATLRGWNMHGDQGWGPPEYTLRQMREHWSMKKVYLVQRLLGSNATILCAFWGSQKSWNSKDDSKDDHKHCTDMQCLALNEVAGGGGHTPGHAPDCEGGSSCSMIGPDIEAVFNILRDPNPRNGETDFPIFRAVDQQDGSLGLEVISWNTNGQPPFATFSHVWKDGMGNKQQNAIYRCQLRLLRDLLRAPSEDKRNGSDDIFPFWLDTFGIPCGASGALSAGEMEADQYKDLKQAAMGQIYHIYTAAAHSIVIDRSLFSCSPENPFQFAVNLVVGGWMGRVWTLQEAFLSKRLWIAVRSELYYKAVDLDDLIQFRLGNVPTGFEDVERVILRSMAATIQREIYRNMPRSGGRTQPRSNPLEFSNPAIAVIDAIQSLRWRSTTMIGDEIMTLATLLRLEYDDINQLRSHLRSDGKTGWIAEASMCVFWKLLQRKYGPSIPPGIIFLTGAKLSAAGFRWAPRTFMSWEETHPFPLSIADTPAELKDDGLLVRYPGYLLHGEILHMFVSADVEKIGVCFPVDINLKEWYRVGDHDMPKNQQAVKQLSELGRSSQVQFAIIISRPSPKEEPPETCLLVHIYDVSLRTQRNRPELKEVLHCRIVQHMGISRISDPKDIGLDLSDKDTCIGEFVDTNQEWCVDGFGPLRPPSSRSGISREMLSIFLRRSRK